MPDKDDILPIEEEHLSLDALDDADVFDPDDEIETIGKDSSFDPIED